MDLDGSVWTPSLAESDRCVRFIHGQSSSGLQMQCEKEVKGKKLATKGAGKDDGGGADSAIRAAAGVGRRMQGVADGTK